MAKRSTDKGKRGEREVVTKLAEFGLPADRTAALQAGRVPGAADVRIRDFPALHVEVKRDERMSVDAMRRQAETEAPASAVPVVMYRRNGGAWAAVVPLDHYAGLLSAFRRA